MSDQKTIYAQKFLNFSVQSWFIVAALGQWIFLAYVTLFYGRLTFSGNLEGYNRVLPHGYVEGDILGNTWVVIHVLIAIVIITLGPLQIIPQIRNRYRGFHRWSGRVYLTTAVITAITGLIMVWTRGTVGGTSQHIAISVVAGLIICFSAFSLRAALGRDFSRHRKWALRLFMVANAVWFYRISLMFWLAIHGGPVGFDMKSFTGPFLDFLAFAQFVVPLLFLQLYFYAQESGQSVLKMTTAVSVFVLTLAMAFGIFAATMGMWLPRIS